jgi:hypothetical protein
MSGDPTYHNDPFPPFTPDPARPPQSSGMADVQLAEYTGSLVATYYQRVIEQNAALGDRLERAVDSRLAVIDEQYKALLRGQAGMQQHLQDQIARLAAAGERRDERIDAIEAQITNLPSQLLGQMSPTQIEAMVAGWIGEAVRHEIHRPFEILQAGIRGEAAAQHEQIINRFNELAERRFDDFADLEQRVTRREHWIIFWIVAVNVLTLLGTVAYVSWTGGP